MSAPLAAVVRSGLSEEYHDGAVAVFDPNGNLIAHHGEIDQPFFIRSSAKPFQAQAALEGGVEINDLQLAVACASHSGDPVHVSLVETILAGAGLQEEDLGCPPARPFRSGDRLLASLGDVAPTRRYHNCSGKHAAMLAVCVANGWDTGAYLDPDHPLQQRIGRLIRETTADDPHPPGVDGCGAPVWQVTTRGLARAFSRLAGEERFARVRRVMSAYPMIVSGEGRPDGLIGRWLGAAVKGGAAGCMGAAIAGHGIAAKAWSGSGAVAAMGVMAALEMLGVVTPAIGRGLDTVSRPVVLGGGREVGRYRLLGALEIV